MSEESKPKKKSSVAVNVFNLVAGLLGAAGCFGFVLVSHRMGLKLDAQIPGIGLSVQDALVVGGALSAGVSIYGAKKLPGDGQ